MFEEAADVQAGYERRLAEEGLERSCLDMVIGLLNQPFKQSNDDSIIISGLAVMGIREDGRWIDAVDYTPVYSAILKVARMLVFYQLYLEREDEVTDTMFKWNVSEDEARDEAWPTVW